MKTVGWLSSRSDAVEDATLQALTPLMPTLPIWLNELWLEWDESEGEVYLSVATDEPACYATLSVHPQFMALGEASKRRTVAHEIAHIYLARIDEVVESILDAAWAEGSQQRVLSEAVYATAVEAVAEQLAGVLLRSVPEGGL